MDAAHYDEKYKITFNFPKSYILMKGSNLFVILYNYITGTDAEINYRCIEHGEQFTVCTFCYPTDVVAFIRRKMHLDIRLNMIKELKIVMSNQMITELITLGRMVLFAGNNAYTLEVTDGLSNRVTALNINVVNAFILVSKDKYDMLREAVKPNRELIRLNSHSVSEMYVPVYMREYLEYRNQYLAFITRLSNSIMRMDNPGVLDEYVLVTNIENNYDINNNLIGETEKLPGGKIQFVVRDGCMVVESPLEAIKRELCEEWLIRDIWDGYNKTFLDIFFVDNSMAFVMVFE
jgi:hypothetical protein